MLDSQILWSSILLIRALWKALSRRFFRICWNVLRSAKRNLTLPSVAKESAQVLAIFNFKLLLESETNDCPGMSCNWVAGFQVWLQGDLIANCMLNPLREQQRAVIGLSVLAELFASASFEHALTRSLLAAAWLITSPYRVHWNTRPERDNVAVSSGGNSFNSSQGPERS